VKSNFNPEMITKRLLVITKDNSKRAKNMARVSLLGEIKMVATIKEVLVTASFMVEV
jgi:hypothetical protein